MSGSDSDFDNALAFRGESRSIMVQASGRNFETTTMNINNASVAGSMIAGNYGDHSWFRERGRYGFDGREVSPRSVRTTRSVIDMKRPGLQQSFRQHGFAQSSMVNGYSRAMSPESVKSIGSNATDIITSFKNCHKKVNKYDVRNIKKAYEKFMKSHARVSSRIEKKRNLKKRARRRSSYDSGDQASNSSISSDDCGSSFTQNKNYSRYMESFKNYAQRTSDDAVSTKSHFTDIRKTIKDNSVCINCSNKFRQDSFRNVLSLGSKNMSSTAINRTQNTTINRTQQESLKSSFLFPSQRFTKSNTVMPIQEEDNENKYPERRFKKVPHTNTQTNSKRMDSEDQDYNMFIQPRETPRRIIEQPETQRKRNLNNSDYSPSAENKRIKLSSPVKDSQKKYKKRQQVQAKEPASPEKNSEKPNNDFVFAKPCLPVRKSTNPQPVTINSPPMALGSNSNAEKAKEATNNDDHSETLQSCASDVSARPSFIKRKLFTQTLDVTESRNISHDSSSSISPQTNVYSALAKEKTKARKLVTSQSCLSREVNNENNNLLDLIHKIVPPDRMNATAQKSEVCQNSIDTGYNSNRLTQESRWDMTSLLSNCNHGEISDTYTDEEIFVVRSEDKSKKEANPIKTLIKDSRIVETKYFIKGRKEEKKNNKAEIPVKEVNKNMHNYAHDFWNCDSESEEKDQPKQSHATKENSVDNSMSHGKQDPNRKNLENSRTSNDSSQYVEEIGQSIEEDKNNKKICIKAARHLKEKKSNLTKPAKPTDLKESLCHLLNENKTQRKTKKHTEIQTANKQKPEQEANSKQSGTENKHLETEQFKQKSNVDQVNPNNKTNNTAATKGRPYDKINETIVTKDQKIGKSNGSTAVKEPNTKISVTVAKVKINRLLENSSNTDFSDNSLNATKRVRGRSIKLLQGTDLSENCLNATERSRERPRKMVNTNLSENSMNTTRRGRARPRNTVNTVLTENSLNSTDLSDNGLNAIKRVRGRPGKLLQDTDLSENSLNTTKRGRLRPRNTVNTDLPEKSLNTTMRLRPRKPDAIAKSNLNMTTRQSSRRNTTNTSALIANKIYSKITTTVCENPKKLTNARGVLVVEAENLNMETMLNAKTVKNTASSLANVKSPRRLTQVVQSTSQGNKKSPKKNTTRHSSTATKRNEVTITPPTKIKHSSNTQITRRSRENSFDTLKKKLNDPRPKQNILNTVIDPQKNLKSKTNVMTSNETKAMNKHRKPMDASNKENTEIDSSLGKSSRTRTVKPKFNSCDEKPDENKVKPKTVPGPTLQANTIQTSKHLELSIAPERQIGVPDSPCRVKPRSQHEPMPESIKVLGRWGLGSATTGVVPQHCVTEQAYIDDDADSVTVRSMASTSVLTRSRRPKFLHVY